MKNTSLKKRCLTAFATATALVSTPAAAGEYYKQSDGEKSVHVYEVNQDEGVRLVREFNNKTKLQHGSDEYYEARTRYIRNEIRKDMRAKGYDMIFVSRFSQQLAEAFSQIKLTKTEALTFDENDLRPFNGTGPFAHINPMLSMEHCTIVTASLSYSPQTWIKDWVGLENTASLPTEYGRMIAEFANYHERAHCMKFDENGADYVATLQMLRDYQDRPELVKGLLWLMSGIRYYREAGSDSDMSIFYKYTGSNIHLAMRDYAANPARYQHDSLIYDLRQNGMPEDQDVEDAYEKYQLPSLSYMESIAKKPLCKADVNVTVSYTDKRCFIS